MAKMEYAGFWVRVGAYLIDSLILAIPAILLMIPFIITQRMIFLAMYYVIYMPIVWLYFAGLESSKAQATFGKRALGLKVVDYKGKRITLARATGRWLSKIISGLILCVGYIMIGFTEKKQGLHDLIVETYVVRK